MGGPIVARGLVILRAVLRLNREPSVVKVKIGQHGFRQSFNETWNQFVEGAHVEIVDDQGDGGSGTGAVTVTVPPMWFRDP